MTSGCLIALEARFESESSGSARYSLLGLLIAKPGKPDPGAGLPILSLFKRTFEEEHNYFHLFQSSAIASMNLA